MSSPHMLVKRQFCCHPQSLEGYVCTHPFLPLREDESHRSVNEVTHLVLLIMHWYFSSRFTDVQDTLQGSNAACLSPERIKEITTLGVRWTFFVAHFYPPFSASKLIPLQFVDGLFVLWLYTFSFIHGWINLSKHKPGQSLFIMHGLLSLEWRIIMSIGSSSSGVE